MKLTSKVLERLIREVISENQNKAFTSDYEREQHLRQQQEEAEERRRKKKELRPDYELMQLSKGILEEGELLAEPDGEGFVRIKKDALQRMLSENLSQLEQQCNKASMYKLDQILGFISKLKAAEKGKA